jgi:hypothetical protein
VTAIDSDVRRGLPLRLQGQVCTRARPARTCASTCSSPAPSLPSGVVVGSLSTNDQGRFDGAVVIPRDFSLGDYDLLVATPGDSRCAPGRTR